MSLAKSQVSLPSGMLGLKNASPCLCFLNCRLTCENIEELLTERYEGLCCSSMGQMLGITPTHVSNRAPF